MPVSCAATIIQACCKSTRHSTQAKYDHHHARSSGSNCLTSIAAILPLGCPIQPLGSHAPCHEPGGLETRRHAPCRNIPGLSGCRTTRSFPSLQTCWRLVLALRRPLVLAQLLQLLQVASQSSAFTVKWGQPRKLKSCRGMLASPVNMRVSSVELLAHKASAPRQVPPTRCLPCSRSTGESS